MIVGDIMEAGHSTLDQVVDLGTKDYAIVVSMNPEPEFFCYAIRNKATFVDEYLSSNLAKARFVITEMQKDLDEGYDRFTKGSAPGNPFIRESGAGGGPISGALNG